MYIHLYIYIFIYTYYDIYIDIPRSDSKSCTVPFFDESLGFLPGFPAVQNLNEGTISRKRPCLIVKQTQIHDGPIHVFQIALKF
jgi:hypothetical protein